jgi:AraC family transcriptional activator of pobA
MKPRRIPIHGLNDYAEAEEEVKGIYVGRFRETINRLPNRLRLHRHEYYEVFYLEGNGAHFNDFLVFPITAPTLVFVSPGQVHRWYNADRLHGWIVCFTQELFDGSHPPPSPLLKHSFWYPENASPVLALPADAAEEIESIFAEMNREYASKSTGFEQALAALLRILFIRSERLYVQANSNMESDRSSALMREFRLALEENFHTMQSVGAYAKLLKVSSDRLGKSVQERSGRSAGEIIRQRLLLEAQRLLAHTEMAVSEIAYALNFQDPAFQSLLSPAHRSVSGRIPRGTFPRIDSSGAAMLSIRHRATPSPTRGVSRGDERLSSVLAFINAQTKSFPSDNMKTYQYNELGLENLILTDALEPQPGSRDVVVKFYAASLNYRDLLFAWGSYNPNPKFPAVPLSDGAGEVVATGKEVTRWKTGDRVCPIFMQGWINGPCDAAKGATSLGGGGEYAGVLREFGAFHEEGLIRIPDYLSFEQAATLPCAAVTAWNALVRVGKLKAGDTILTLGTGGVSIFALQFAKMHGTRHRYLEQRRQARPCPRTRRP